MSKKTLYSILIIVIIILLAVFLSMHYKNKKMENGQMQNGQQMPVNTTESISNNIDNMNTSVDYENNGDVQQDFQSIDQDIGTL